VTLPFVLLLLDFWPLKRIDAKSWGLQQRRSLLKLVFEKLPLFILIAVFSVLAYITQAQEGAVKPLSDYPAMLRLANVPVNYATYLVKMIWPTKMAYMYPYPLNVQTWQVAGSMLILVMITFWVFKLIRPFPYAAMGWFWFLGTLVPVIGIVVIGPYAVADRYTYISFIGLFVMIAWGVPDFLHRWHYSRSWLTCLTVAVILVYAVIAWKQVGYWRDNETLSRHTIAVTKDNLAAYLNLGVTLQEEGRFAEASELYYKMLDIEAQNISALKNLGVLAKHQGRFDDAIAFFQQAIAIDPADETIYNNLGNTLTAKGRHAAAIDSYEKAIALNPKYTVAFYNAGNAYYTLKQLDQAIERYEKALALDPLYAEAHNNLGSALALQGYVQAAMRHFYQALQLKPDYTDARNNLMKLARRYQKKK
jgi:tetratricopeptide (TPR) repeat protein